MIRTLTTRALNRLLAAAGLARIADVEHERRRAGTIRAAERAHANRETAAALAKLKKLDEKLRAAHGRFAAEHAESGTLAGLLRHYLVRLRRTEVELAERATLERRLRVAQLAIGVKAARRRGITPEAATRAAHLSSISADYSAAASRWRAGDRPADIRRATIARLQWSAPADTADRLSQRLVERGELPLDDFAAVRDFAVGGIMLDIGAHIGLTSIPRIILGDFAQVYAAEPDRELYLCLIGNTQDNRCEGHVLPDRVAIAGSSRPIGLRSPRGDVEEVRSLTVDEWVTRLGIAADEIRFVRIALQPWNLDVLHGAAHLLKRRRIVWQIDVSPALLGTAGPASEELCRGVAAHFTHVKELGRHFSGAWRPASEAAVVLDMLSRERRSTSLLLFNLPSGTRRRGTAHVAAGPDSDEQPGSGALISVLHSTARLPDGWRPAMEAFLANAKDPKNVEYILAVDEHEEFTLASDEQLTRWGRHALVKEGVTGPNSGYNAAARVSRGDILMTIADDYFPPAGWDEAIRRAVGDVNHEVVLDVDNSDGSRWLLPFSMLTRKYYERYGYILYPGYHGLCSDNEFTEQARRDGVVRSARHIVFEHRHPDRGHAPMDDIYARQKEHYEEAQRLFRERQAKGFPKWPD